MSLFCRKKIVIGHSLFEMVRELGEKEKTFIEIEDEAKRLDRFYIPTRYPNGLPGGSPFQAYTLKDLKVALDDLHRIFALARKFLNMINEK